MLIVPKLRICIVCSKRFYREEIHEYHSLWLPTQPYEPLYYENSCFYLPSVLRIHKNISLFLSLSLEPHLKPSIFGTNRNFARADFWDAAAHPNDRGTVATGRRERPLRDK